MDNISIKNNIMKIRKARKITQESMALSLGMSLTAYRDFERGKTSVMNMNVLKIASLLNIPAEELVLGYRPHQINDSANENLLKEYANRINEQERRIADLEILVESLQDAVSSKNEIIAMLKKSLGEDK
jgi:transcriptional regulator with XRE-family HTH domain